MVVMWNVLFLIDRGLLGFPVVGPFATLALLLFSALAFTIPKMRLPGSWLVKEERFVRRWRYVFWYIGVLLAVMAIVAVYDLVFGLDNLPG